MIFNFLIVTSQIGFRKLLIFYLKSPRKRGLYLIHNTRYLILFLENPKFVADEIPGQSGNASGRCADETKLTACHSNN